MSDAWDLLSCLIISFVVTHSPDSGLTGTEGTIFPTEISAKPPKDNLSRGEIAYIQTLDIGQLGVHSEKKLRDYLGIFPNMGGVSSIPKLL